jgi:excisionase family DNA binding protein
MNHLVQFPPLIHDCGGDQKSPVLTLKQTAEYLGISKAHLSNVISGRIATLPPLRHARVGRRILIKRAWADEWLETTAQQSARQC